MSPEQMIDTPEHAQEVASMMHQEWRASRAIVKGQARDGEPKREERWKPVDPAQPNGPKIDIANTPFDKLPPAWQHENLLAAEAALSDEEALAGTAGFVDLEEASARTHVHWKDRNTWATGEQAGPYKDLSPAEKDKDRSIIERSTGLVAKEGVDVKLTNTFWAKMERLERDLQATIVTLQRHNLDHDTARAARKSYKDIQRELGQLRLAIHMDTPYASYDPKREGTEGARPDLTVMPPGEEDRYGLRDGESVEDKQHRQQNATGK